MHPFALWLALSICAPCVRAHMDFLASDTLRGRGSATTDEHVAAIYIESQFEQDGLETQLQTVTLRQPELASLPALEFNNTVWTHGKEILVFDPVTRPVEGPLQKISGDQHANKGAVVYANPPNVEKLVALFKDGAAAVILPTREATLARWKDLSAMPRLTPIVVGAEPLNPRSETIRISPEAMPQLEALPDGTTIRLRSELKGVTERTTINVIGILRGREPDAILLTAHYDHLGVGAPREGDAIFNGADDDASGTTAVLELARTLSAGPKPKRTIAFVLFGSEELGALGASYFREHPSLPLERIVANLEFEMIGTQDPKLDPGAMLLTGWERSNFGPTLRDHGAKIAPDPRPQENLFRRSDNYALALKGVVAHTTGSSPSTVPFYHRQDDDLQHVDFNFMTAAIDSLVEPIRWLANSDFKPAWNPGGQP